MVFGQLLLFACLCGCCCCGLGAFVVGQTVIKNLSIKEMHKQYEERKKNLSGPRRDYYDGELFQRKCDRLFDEFDEDGNGSLDMSELKPLIQREIGEDIGDFHCAIIRSAFDENGDSTVEKAEFKHMMQFISMIKFKEGNFSEDTAFEVLQVDPKTGTHADVKKSYRKLSLKYHPDKRTDVPDEERRSMDEGAERGPAPANRRVDSACAAPRRERPSILAFQSQGQPFVQAPPRQRLLDVHVHNCSRAQL